MKVFRLKFGRDIEHLFIFRERRNRDITLHDVFEALDSEELRPLAKKILEKIYIDTITTGSDEAVSGGVVFYAKDDGSIGIDPKVFHGGTYNGDVYGKVEDILSLKDIDEHIFQDNPITTFEEIIDMHASVDPCTSLDIYEIDQEDISNY
jgi:hypothetical protein